MKTLYFFILSPIYLLWILLGAAHENCFAYQPQTKNRLNLLTHYPGINTAADYAGSVSLELHSTSVLLEKEILEQGQIGQPVVVDVVGIGGGPQNAIAFSILKQLYPNLSTLVFEGSHRAGTFDKLRGTFQLNSPENYSYESHLLKNIFVGSPIQMTDFLDALSAGQHVFQGTNPPQTLLSLRIFSRMRVCFLIRKWWTYVYKNQRPVNTESGQGAA